METTKRFSLGKGSVLLMMLLFTLAVMTWLTGTDGSKSIGFQQTRSQFLNTGWVSVQPDGTELAIDLPVELPVTLGEPAVIQREIPDFIPWQNTVCVRASMQSIRAYVDGECIYTYGVDQKNPADARSGWACFRLPSDSAGKALRLEFSSPYRNFSGKINNIYFSNKTSIMYDILLENSFSFFLFVVLMLLGTLMLMLYATSLVPGMRNDFLLYLGLFFLLVGLWIFGESKTMQFFLGNSYVIGKLSFYTLLAAPLPFALYLKSTRVLHNSKIIDWFFWLFCINLVVSLVLELTGTLYLFSSLISTHVLIVAFSVVMIASFLYETFYHRNQDAKEQLIGIGILGVAAILEIIPIWLNSFGQITRFFGIGVLAYVGYMSNREIHRMRQRIVAYREKDYLERLAYQDALTQGNNRMAFQRDVAAAFEADSGKNNYLVLLDLDHLKYINDHIGHQAGDTAIKLAFQCISEAFRDTGTVYRIGGDEYACIAKDTEEDHILRCLEKLDQLMSEQNKTLEFDFGISYGWGRFQPEADCFKSFFEGVDQRLYANKAAKKAAKGTP